MLVLLALSLAAAEAGTVTFEKKGLQLAWVYVDGQPHGKLDKRSGLALELPDGTHEIWITRDEPGVVVGCRGLVEVSGATVVEVRDTGCPALTPGIGPKGTFAKGAFVAVRGPAISGKWVSVDGGRATAMSHLGAELNLTPGPHAIVIAEDVGGNEVVCQGRITAAASAPTLVVSEAGCVGFEDQITVTIQP